MKNDKKPSEIFLRACENVVGSAGMIRECQCGRVTFNPDPTWSWEDGELEEYQAKATKDPDKYLEVEYAVPSIVINNKEFVIGCPCNDLAIFEALFWNSRSLIAEYLKLKADDIADRAKTEAETAAKTVDAVHKIEEE